MNTATLILIVSTLVSFLLPVLLLGRKQRTHVHTSLFAFCVSLAIWMQVSHFTDVVGPFHLKLWLMRMSYFTSAGAVLMLYRFTWYYPFKRMPQKEIWQGYYITFGVLALITLLTDTIVQSIAITPTVTNVLPGVLHSVFLIFVAIGFSFAMIRLWWARKQTEDLAVRTQIGYFGLGLSVGVGYGMLTSGILPVVAPQLEASKYSPLTAVFIIVPMVLALLRQRLMDVRLFMVRSLAYICSFGLFFFTSVFLISLSGTEMSDVNYNFVVLVVLLVLFLAPQVVQYFDQMLRTRLFHDAYEGRELLTIFNKIITSKADLATMLARTAQLIEDALGVNYAVFGVRKGEDIIGRIAGGHGKLPPELDLSRLNPQLLHIRKRLIHTLDLSHKHKLLRNKLLQNNIGLVARIARSNDSDKQLGFLIVGTRKNGRQYTRQDIKLVSAIIEGLAPVIEKSLSVEQDFEHVTQEMYRKNLELVETNRTLSLLRAIDALVLESQDSLEVLTTAIAKAITNNSNFTSVAIFARMPGKSDIDLFGRSLPLDSKATIADLPKIALDPDAPWLKSDQRELKLMVTPEQLAHHKQLGLTKNTITQLYASPDVHMVYLLKLQARQKVVGAMAIGFVNSHENLTPEDINLLERLSDAVGVAVDNRLLFEENQRVLKQLQKTNDKLRALDEAKDEFISMASHQLRTPLTSVKGYVSMVIEGDAGKLTKMQHDLLGQAFASSQRMVYLIADLLNVSRLRTGKFVIENKPTQLADVVETELSQLQEAAKTKKQALVYKKPKNFPSLMLDETKIRQVVMNFTDNALYYTQAGGKIVVNLEQKGKSIEFTVVDNGIGVPKEEQHKLFAKFYRAGNARKARPDGTGLGLFMAKKVIIAQGGAVIFRTAENKGSTFGFSFPIDKLKVSAAAANKATSDGITL